MGSLPGQLLSQCPGFLSVRPIPWRRQTLAQAKPPCRGLPEPFFSAVPQPHSALPVSWAEALATRHTMPEPLPLKRTAQMTAGEARAGPREEPRGFPARATRSLGWSTHLGACVQQVDCGGGREGQGTPWLRQGSAATPLTPAVLCIQRQLRKPVVLIQPAGKKHTYRTCVFTRSSITQNLYLWVVL